MFADIGVAVKAAHEAALAESLPRSPIACSSTLPADTAYRMLLNLANAKQIHFFILGIAALGSSFPYSTGCSGTDCCSLGISGLLQALDRLGISRLAGKLHCKHVASAESDLRKHPLMLAIQDLSGHSAGHLYDDIAHLSDETPHYDYIQKELSSSNELVKLFIAGFSCVVVSRLNPNQQSASSRTCILNETGETGSTFSGVRAFHRARRNAGLCGAILENVPALRDNCQHLKCIASLDEDGYVCTDCTPQRRDTTLRSHS